MRLQESTTVRATSCPMREGTRALPNLPRQNRSAMRSRTTSPISVPDRLISLAAVVPVQRDHRCSATSGSATTTASNFQVTLETEEISNNVEFSRSRDGERTSSIFVSKVKPGSVAEREGLKVGQKLSAISNPSQPGDMWSLNERPSLRFVTDAVRLTRQTSVTVEVTEIAASAAQGSDVKDDSEASLMDNMKEAIDGASGKETIASKLAIAFKEEEDTASRERKQREQRRQRRQEYMQRESSRDNTKFFLGLAASFFLPAIGILAYAFSSGLMDRIGSSYRPY